MATRSDHGSRVLLVVMTIAGASLAASFVSGTLIAGLAAVTTLPASNPDLVSVIKAGAILFLLSSVVGCMFALPLTIAGAAIGYLVLRFAGGRPPAVFWWDRSSGSHSCAGSVPKPCFRTSCPHLSSAASPGSSPG